MDMTEKNGQPSMEEILASIRRIIAEEPADSISLDFKPRHGTGPGPGPGNGAEQLAIDDSTDFELPSMFRAAASAPATEKPAGSSVKLMDALRATPQLGAEFSSRSQPEFPLPSSLNNGHETPRPAAWAEQHATAHQALSSLRQAARPENPASQSPASQSNGNSHQLPTFAVPSVEAVSIEVQNEQSWAPELGQPELNRQEFGYQAPAAFEPFLSGPVQDAAEAPVARQMVPFRDQHFARMRGGIANEPTTVAPIEVVAVEPVAPILANVAVDPAPAPTLPEAASFATLAVKSSFPTPLHILALGSVPPALPSSPAPDADAVAMISAVAPAPLPTLSSPPSASNAAVPAVGAVGAIEDATAELLRPMLRQWLSDNMPRMVEKALHIEVAESVKPGKKQSLL